MELLTFVDTHNMVAYLSKSDASEGFDQILDFLNASTIRYALIVNPTIYVSCIKQFWSTAKVKTVNGVVKLQALIDGKNVFVLEAIIRRDLHLEDAEGVECLPNNEIFEELARMGYEKPPPKLTFYKAFFAPQWKFLIHTLIQCLSAKRATWNEFSSTMASAVIRLATGRKFNFKIFLDNQVDDMTSHHTQYTSPTLTQKVFANMRRVGKGFSGNKTPLFDTMLPSTPHDSPEQEPTHLSPHDSPLIGVNPPRSKKGSLQLAELMALCTSLQRKVDALEKDKLAQATKLEKRRKSKPSILRRLRKIGHATRVESSEEASLGVEENAFKQGGKIYDIDVNAEISLVDETQRLDDDLIFDTTADLGGEEVVVKPAETSVSAALDVEVSAADPAITTVSLLVTIDSVTITTAELVSVAAKELTDNDMTIAEALAELKTFKPKVVTTIPILNSATTVTTTKPKAKRITIQEPLVELEEEASVATLAELYDVVQAQIDADQKLAARITLEEHEKYTVEERARMLAEFIKNRKKQLAVERAEAIRSKPPTKSQLRNLMMTYLKNTGRFTHAQLKHRDFEEIQGLYNKEKELVDTFVPIGSEEDERRIKDLNTKAEEESSNKDVDSTNKRKKRIRMKRSSKKQKTDADLKEEEQLKTFLSIVPNEEEAIDYEVLDKRYQIVDWKSEFYHNDRYGEPHDYYRVFRADGSSRYIKTFTEMVLRFDRMDFLELHIDELWKNQEDWILKSWNLYENCKVHILMLEDGTEFHMLAERKYPLTNETLEKIVIFADSHNMVAYLEKSEDNADFAEIVDFLNASPISSKSTAWNEFGTNIASAVICLAKKQKFNFSKLIFDAVFNDEYDTPSHTKKVFANMRRQGKDFSGTVTPLFATMLIQSQAVEGEGSGQPTEPQHTPTTASPSHVEPIPIVASSSQPKKTQKHRKTKRKATEISQSSGPTTLVADETVHEERGDSVERAATTATSLDAEQGSGGSPRRQDTILGDRPAQTRFERLSKQSNEPPLSRVNTLRSGEDSMKLQELMDLYTKLSDKVLDLENVKNAQALEIQKLKKRVKKLESKKKSRTPQLKRRLFKVRIESSAEKSLGDQEDASKQGRNEIDQDKGISCFLEGSETQGRHGHDSGVNTASTSMIRTACR
ncbi:hypothetical protein Tco_1304891 [Tanacetum coccineum]